MSSLSSEFTVTIEWKHYNNNDKNTIICLVLSVLDKVVYTTNVQFTFNITAK